MRNGSGYGRVCSVAIAAIAVLWAGGALAQTSAAAGKSAGISAATAADTLTGTWKGPVQFTSGDFAAVKNLELMYQFAADGTMLESSNYDSGPPVPPAYGIWRRLGERSYEARYQFYQPKPVATADESIKGGGWAPNGHGVLTQLITLSADGDTFTATIKLEMFDTAGKSLGNAGEATATGARMKF